jgi:hypothetical protein
MPVWRLKITSSAGMAVMIHTILSRNNTAAYHQWSRPSHPPLVTFAHTPGTSVCHRVASFTVRKPKENDPNPVYSEYLLAVVVDLPALQFPSCPTAILRHALYIQISNISHYFPNISYPLFPPLNLVLYLGVRGYSRDMAIILWLAESISLK